MAASPFIDAAFVARAKELGSGFLSLSEEEQDKLLKAVLAPSSEIAEHTCKNDVLHWLQNFTATENPQFEAMGLSFRAPFPRKEYFVPLFKAFATYPRLFICKSRDMMTSWAVMGFSTHRAQWFKEETIVQTGSEAKASELIDYCSQLWRNQPESLRQRHPLKANSSMEIAWADGGRVLAIPAGEAKIRLFHPTRYVQDESSFLPEGEECFNAAFPVCKWVVCISTAAPGWFQFQCQRGLTDGSL